MTLPTHLAFASALYLGGAALFGYRPDPVGWALAAVASPQYPRQAGFALIESQRLGTVP